MTLTPFFDPGGRPRRLVVVPPSNNSIAAFKRLRSEINKDRMWSVGIHRDDITPKLKVSDQDEDKHKDHGGCEQPSDCGRKHVW